MEILKQAIKKAFIDKTIPSDRLNPKFIINSPEKKEYLLTTLQNDLNNCKTFFISVAFVTQSGLNAIKSQLADLESKGISGKILTSTYLGFNNPDVFASLLKIPNVEVRISKKAGFHSKGYLFDMGGYNSFIIGSSNLTMSALKLNYEWNVKLTSSEHGEMISTIQTHLKNEWAASEPLTEKWIEDFKKIYKPITNTTLIEHLMPYPTDVVPEKIAPNKMQEVALESLRNLRKKGEKKGLVISATGTGKTYLAAFDSAQFNPKRMLFIVHREQILNKALESFKKIMGGKDSDYGILSGSSKNMEAKYLFATIQTVSKESYQQILGKDAFDYILIDEVHKAGAKSYINTIDFFEPEFLLGMTATPERTDGFNIYALFDYNIAYEIRLQEALSADMLCPFYYFGVTDYEKEGQIINELSDLQKLTDHERVEFLLKKIDYYGCSGNVPKGLVFCSRKDEAQKLAEMFNERNIPSAYLSGDHDLNTREIEVSRLEAGELNYIFTVDIFNEGIDIPKVNQIIMLRNTESSIIFIQQLGRGLRKDESKEFVTVIDFIGNYKNNYMIPMALAGDNSRNKNNLRRDTIDATYIDGLSAINFEKIAKERIFQSIDKAKLDSMSELRNSFHKIKKRLNRVPYLVDFQSMDGVDPSLIIGKEKTYYNFLKKINEAEGSISEAENLALKFISVEFLSGVRPHELLILKLFLESDRESIHFEEIKNILSENKLLHSQKITESVMKVLDLSFYESGARSGYMPSQLFKMENDTLFITDNFKQFKNNPYFVKLMLDVIYTGIEKSTQYTPSQPLELYKKYRRKDVLRLLAMDFKQNEQGIGGYTYSNKQFVIFVTLDKGKDFKGSLLAYEDEFIDEGTFRWFTKAPRTIESPEVKLLKDPEEWTIHLFVKRKYTIKDNEIDFYYLGEVSPIQETIRQIQKPVSDGKLKNVVEMDFTLKEVVEPNIYEFLTKTSEE
ncbi:NgoFVII family restriction endonuclease [Enterococcus sp. JM4C]|uniref:DUF3427 domain-containing protein n=1 Tax=Candidatus Enterococcus huntleyi TaxID=1857217 RepID=UPI00137A06C7|nr:DEAD/DEAH box helicase [Enterococcus sp. JM4C]KAF1299376.1 NgoFVII family restriction endonuclease [Enterococcus sp. JM4C]